MAGTGERMTSERRLAANEKQHKALELRKAGYDFRTIASQVGYKSPASAHDAVKNALKALVQQPAEELRVIELERLDQSWKSIYPQIIKGNLGAIDRGIRIMERRASLLGLDAPKETNSNLNVNTDAVKLVGIDPGDI